MGGWGGGEPTPGLALLFPSLMFPANNPVNAQERLWKSPAPRLSGSWGRWVPVGEGGGQPLVPLPQPPRSLPAPSRDPAGTGKGPEL